MEDIDKVTLAYIRDAAEAEVDSVVEGIEVSLSGIRIMMMEDGGEINAVNRWIDTLRTIAYQEFVAAMTRRLAAKGGH